ncbi:hypothetical protein MMC25_004090 [Agyrium rufum]|nr:hypothetical protein [Agyrium rufum]
MTNGDQANKTSDAHKGSKKKTRCEEPSSSKPVDENTHRAPAPCGRCSANDAAGCHATLLTESAAASSTPAVENPVLGDGTLYEDFLTNPDGDANETYRQQQREQQMQAWQDEYDALSDTP